MGRGTAAAVSDADKALAADLACLREAVSGLTVRLEAREADELAKEGVATKEDLQVLTIYLPHLWCQQCQVLVQRFISESLHQNAACMP